MYAARRVYVKQWDHQSPDERYTVQIARGGKPVPGIQSDRISAIEEEVMYWRKANHIRGWFVNNVQRGVDDCKSYYVGWDKMRALLDTCKKVIEASRLVDGTVYVGTVYDKNHPEGVDQREPGQVIAEPAVANELLPTTQGFFFGSCEYDEWYLYDVQDTHDWAARMLLDHDNGVPGDIIYSSSW